MVVGSPPVKTRVFRATNDDSARHGVSSWKIPMVHSDECRDGVIKDILTEGMKEG